MDIHILARKRKIQYITIFVGLCIGYILLRDSTWVGNKQLHTIMEVIATLLALIIGILALLRYYTKKGNDILFVAVGFLGTAFLDGYHAVVTSNFFDQLWPSLPASLIPWSWVASRFFLSIFMLVSWWAWKREKEFKEKGKINELSVYVGTGLFTLLSFFFFAFYPLPRAYYPELFFGRPEEFIPAFFFLLALIGYLTKGKWKTSALEHWLVISLIVGFMGQVMFMSFSFKLFDMMFDAAHTLKKMSYVCALIGLLCSMFVVFRRAEGSKGKIEGALRQAEIKCLEAEENQQKVENALKAAEESKLILEKKTRELEKTNEFMIDRELRMKELKEEIKKLKGKDGE